MRTATTLKEGPSAPDIDTAPVAARRPTWHCVMPAATAELLSKEHGALMGFGRGARAQARTLLCRETPADFRHRQALHA